MARYNIYLRPLTDHLLNVIFEYLKHIGQIPAAATEIGGYRAQCISFAIGSAVQSIMKDAPEFRDMIDGKTQ